MKKEDLLKKLEELGARPLSHGGGIKIHALHRPDDHPSVNIFYSKRGAWMVYDFAQDRTWSLKEYLAQYAGVELDIAEPAPSNKDEAHKGPYTKPAPKPLDPKAEAMVRNQMGTYRSLLRFRRAPTGYIKERMVDLNYAEMVGLGIDEHGNIAAPMVVPYKEGGEWHWQPRNIQLRQANGEPKYRYCFSGLGSGYYVVGNLKNPKRIIITEGTLNAPSAYIAIRKVRVDYDEWLVIGVPGASDKPRDTLIQYLKERVDDGAIIYLVYDNDTAGLKGNDIMLSALMSAGIDAKKIYPAQYHPLDWDFNELLMRYGPSEEVLKRVLHSYKPSSLVFNRVATFRFGEVNKGGRKRAKRTTASVVATGGYCVLTQRSAVGALYSLHGADSKAIAAIALKLKALHGTFPGRDFVLHLANASGIGRQLFRLVAAKHLPEGEAREETRKALEALGRLLRRKHPGLGPDDRFAMYGVRPKGKEEAELDLAVVAGAMLREAFGNISLAEAIAQYKGRVAEITDSYYGERSLFAVDLINQFGNPAEAAKHVRFINEHFSFYDRIWQDHLVAIGASGVPA